LLALTLLGEGEGAQTLITSLSISLHLCAFLPRVTVLTRIHVLTYIHTDWLPQNTSHFCAQRVGG